MLPLILGLEFVSLCVLSFFLMPAIARFHASVDYKQLDVFKPNYRTQDKLILTIERYYRYAYWYVGIALVGLTTAVIWGMVVNFTTIEYRMLTFVFGCLIGVVAFELVGRTKEVIRFFERWEKEGISRDVAITLLNPKLVDLPEPTILRHYDYNTPNKYVVFVLMRQHDIHNQPLPLYAYSDVPVPSKHGVVCGPGNVDLIHPKYQERIIEKINMDYSNHSINSYSFVDLIQTRGVHMEPTTGRASNPNENLGISS